MFPREILMMEMCVQVLIWKIGSSIFIKRWEGWECVKVLVGGDV